MPNNHGNASPLFLQLVLSLQSAAWYQMGKTVSPISGEIDRDLDQARVSIDLLVMLQEKTKGNLLNEETRILEDIVYNLQMNFLEELNKDKEGTGAETAGQMNSADSTADNSEKTEH